MDTSTIPQSNSIATIILLAVISSSVFSAFISIVVGWIKDIWMEKRQEKKRIVKIKENAYREVMKNIDFVYQGSDPLSRETKKCNFLQNYRLIFLYSTDEVIKEINNVLEILVSSIPSDNEEMKEKKNKIARSMLILRKQIVKNTKLTEKDFQHIT